MVGIEPRQNPLNHNFLC